MMDAQGIDSAHIVGNSMGGRIALEMAMIAPERVRALGLLCPAVAWVKRGLHPLVRLLRPEFGLLPHGFRRGMVASQFWSMFADQDVIDPAVGDLMVDEFRRIYHSAGARYAFLSSARNIYLEAPLRQARLLSPAGRARASGIVRVGQPRPPRPPRLQPSRHQVAAGRRADRPRELRPRPAGRVPRGDQPAAACTSSPRAEAAQGGTPIPAVSSREMPGLGR